jgi:predicted transcriptional regulator
VAVRIPDAELELLKVLWEREKMPARELAEAAYGNTTNAAIGTVQKLLQRLEAKRLVGRDRSRHVHRFWAMASREEIAGQQFEALAAKLTDGSLAPILMHLVQAKRLTKRDREDMRRILEGETSSR